MSVSACEDLFGEMRTFFHDRWSIEHATLEAEVNGCGHNGECGAPLVENEPARARSN